MRCQGVVGGLSGTSTGWWLCRFDRGLRLKAGFSTRNQLNVAKGIVRAADSTENGATGKAARPPSASSRYMGNACMYVPYEMSLLRTNCLFLIRAAAATTV